MEGFVVVEANIFQTLGTSGSVFSRLLFYKSRYGYEVKVQSPRRWKRGIELGIDIFFCGLEPNISSYGRDPKNLSGIGGKIVYSIPFAKENIYVAGFLVKLGASQISPGMVWDSPPPSSIGLLSGDAANILFLRP
ncbi:hypothetical protein NC652_032242 [Populus alba x Populus x berolinensis]|nr:hypothetical protein NC652_032242 [Populus alba x Populus x berolinensis]